MRTVQAVVTVVPTALILWWGGTYVLDAGTLLLAPGVPLSFNYKTPDGPVHFRVESYRIEPGTRTASVHGAQVTRPNGRSIASVNAVDASGLNPFDLKPIVVVRGVRVNLEHDDRGFDLIRLIPKHEGPPSKIPYSVTVLDAKVTYTDRTFKKPFVQSAQTERVVFDGLGDDWRASGAVKIPGVGRAEARAQSLPNVGATMDLRSDSLRLERLVPVILPGFSVSSLVARGPVRIDLPKDRTAKIAATLNVEAKDFHYREYALDNVLFNGRVSADGGSGTVLARLGDARARFEGAATQKEGGGQVVANVPSVASLPAWVRRYIPAKASFRDAKYEGWVGWQGIKPRLIGVGSAAHAAYGPDSVDDIRTKVSYSPEAISLRALTARWQGTPVAGDVSFDPKSRAIAGALLAPKVQLAALSKRLGGPKDVSGIIGGTALVSGTVDKPQVEGAVTGRVALQGRSLGDLEVRGAWLGSAARVDRLKVSGPLGAIVAGGKVRPDGTLDLKAEARGIKIERLMPDATGLISGNLNIGGTLHDPKAKGRFEAYRLSYNDQDLPAAGVDLTADKRKIELTGLSAVRGTARLRGRVLASLTGKGVHLTDPKTWLLDGRFSVTGIQANDIPGADAVGDLAGLISVPNAELSGRLGDPLLIAGIEGDGLIVRGVRMESLRADARVDRQGAKVSNFEAIAAGGRVAGGGDYLFAKKHGEVDLQIAGLQLSRLLTDVSQDVMVEGTLSAPKVHLVLSEGKLTGQSDGTLDGVKVNGVLAGDGNWALNTDGNEVKAEASVGRLDPTLRALDASATYKLNEGTLSGIVQAKDLPVQALVAAAESGRSLSEDEAARLATIRGDFSGSVALERSKSGTIHVEATDLQAAALRYLDIDYGTLTATSIVRDGERWNISGTSIEGPAGKFVLTGWYEESGGVDAKITGDAVKLSAFSPFVPDLASITGTARFALNATGTIQHPMVEGTAGVEGLFAKEGTDTVSLDLGTLQVRDGASKVAGVMRYGQRFGGLFSLSTDWKYQDAIEGAGFLAKLDLGTLTALDPSDATKGLRIDPVNLKDIPGLSAYIDARGGGTLSGSFGATGTFGQPKLTGGLDVVASTLGISIPGGGPVSKIDDPLRDVKVSLGFDERNSPTLSAFARLDRGGSIDIRGALANTGQDALETLRTTRDWKGLPITGSVDVKPATIKQSIGGAVTTATIEGSATIAGKAVDPKISGAFVILNLDSNLPSVDASAGDSIPMTFDPLFDLTFALQQPGRFQTATADLYLTGDLSLKGPLSNPVALAELVTQRGSIRLPGGVIRVDPGGQISFAYKRPLSGGTPASADLDLQGRSQVTLSRPGQGTQRYDITLDIRGDVLRENGLNFDATSDPPDLSKDEILNALGRTDLLSSISAGGSSTERNVRNAFAGFALPGLLDNFTGGVARGLGLDYLNVEYNEFDQTTIAFARSLGPDFTFQGRQQVGTPTPGYRSVYDLRLSYNARRLLPKLSRFSFTVGVDQDRPWKTSIEYGTRFGNRGGKEQPKHTIFPAKKTASQARLTLP